MPASKHNILIEKHATFKKKLVWRDSKKRPINLTGYTAKLQIRATHDAAEALFELSTANGRIVITPATGTIELTIAANDTDNFAFKSGVYDLKLETVDGTEIRLLEGKVTVSPGVTR